jgi:shikimate dehydrogenase
MMLTGKATLAGVIGWPIAHSRSPRLHGFWLERHAIDGAYIPMAVREDGVEQAIRALPLLGFRGFNITVPHKETLIRICDSVDDTARRIGAVNTVVIDAAGHLQGSNTDAFGFMENLRQLQPGHDVTAGAALMIGAGGAARAVAVALLDAGVPALRIVNRSRERAERLRSDLGDRRLSVVDQDDWSRRLGGVATLVNTTSLGMRGAPALAIDLSTLDSAALVCDIVYTPLETDLLKQAAARGNPTVDGIGMLLHQARAGFRQWFGVEPTVDAALRDHVLDDQ